MFSRRPTFVVGEVLVGRRRWYLATIDCPGFEKKSVDARRTKSRVLYESLSVGCRRRAGRGRGR